MQDYVVNRPDQEAMEQALRENGGNAAGAILRLAWQAGLMRDEIQHLTWPQVDFLDQRIVLADRAVPIPPELAEWLEELRNSRERRQEETVVLSDRDQRPLSAQSISRLARTALDRVEQREIRLIDLRHDFILRQLESHDWQYVSRITGVEAAGLNVHFAAHLENRKVSTRVCREGTAQIDEFALWKLLRTEWTSPAGVTLWLTWQLGLRLSEIVELRWGQIQGETLRLEDRTCQLSGGVLGVLRDLRDQEQGGRGPEDPVLAVPRTGQPYERTRLSKLARAALIRGGLDDVTLRDLRMDCDVRGGGEPQIVSYLRKNGSITRNEAMELLKVSKTTAYNRLKQMVKRGKLTQVGAKYYLRDDVVAPEEQRTVILDYLSKEGFAYRQDIARLLRIDPRQCRPILQRLIAEGDIVQRRQRYLLKKEA